MGRSEFLLQLRRQRKRAELKVGGGNPNFYLSASLCGWGMGSSTTALEQKPHELPNGCMKKLPAAAAK